MDEPYWRRLGLVRGLRWLPQRMALNYLHKHMGAHLDDNCSMSGKVLVRDGVRLRVEVTHA